MDLLCKQNEWDDSIEMLIDNADTALHMLGEVVPQYTIPHIVVNTSVRHIFQNGHCLGYVEE